MIVPKLVLTDIDGVWTDGGMYYSNTGDELKKFNTKDSAGVLFFNLLNIPVGIITGENTEIVKRRAHKLNINIVELGIKNKLKTLEKISKQLQIEYKDIAYIGDDINDIEVLRAVGLSAVPFDSPNYVSMYADFTLTKKGGEGVFREFAEFILKETGLFEKALDAYLKKL